VAKPSQIDYELMHSYFQPVTRAVMSYEGQGPDLQHRTMQLANQYFARITEVLVFLEKDRDIGNMRELLPTAGFYLPRIFDCPHLAVQRSGSNFDGKYYIVDCFGKAEELTTEMRSASYLDIWQACSNTQKLIEFVRALDTASSSTP
jgi:hypothetical protein